jgi:hypothetical protein
MPINSIMQELIEMSLYEEIDLDEDVTMVISDYLRGESYNLLSVDLYCNECKSRSTYNPYHEEQIRSDFSSDEDAFFEEKVPFAILHYRCARDTAHYLTVQIMKKDNKLIKTGQYPSKADIENPEFDRFAKILPKDKMSDLKRSSGLASHGIGAGSFVYLRRVFEFLLNNAYKEALSNNAITEEVFNHSKVIDKIELLKDYLPSFMSENKLAYGILSKGVHELPEEECLASYHIMKGTIELILDEMLEKRERIKKESEIKRGISELHGKLKK